MSPKQKVETETNRERRLIEDALTNLRHAAEGLSNVRGVQANGIVAVLESLIARAEALLDALT